MEDRFRITQAGQSLQVADMNLVAQEAALADDRVLAELLHVRGWDGFSTYKAIIPLGDVSGNISSGSIAPLVVPGTGLVTVLPFRAVVGNRQYPAQTGKDAWRDLRSTIVAPAGFDGLYGSTPGTTVAIANGAGGGNHRWDIVYVQITVDTNGTTLTRTYKDPSSLNVGPANFSTTVVTKAAFGIVSGTPAATPVMPTIPADVTLTGVYYIPLAAIFVPATYAGGAISTGNVVDIAPIVSLGRHMGTSVIAPCSSNVAISTTAAGTWNSVGRPNIVLPPSMVGGASRIIQIDLASSPVSHAVNAVVDNSIDWRRRYFKYQMQYSATSGDNFASCPVAPATPSNLFPSVAPSGTPRTNSVGMGQSMRADMASVTTGPSTGAGVAYDSTFPQHVFLYVDMGTGALKVYYYGVTASLWYFWLDATAPLLNF